MPELPEVETIRRGLEPKVVGRRIVQATVRLKKQVRGMGAPAFERAIKGRKILRARRRAKFLLFDLEGAKTLLIHLGMSGQVSFWDHRKPDENRFTVSPLTGLQRAVTQHAPDKHTHALFTFDQAGGDRMQYRDIRQFGYLRLLETDAIDKLPSIRRLGLEPLGAGFTWDAFSTALRGRRGMLKALLLNQSAIVGLGNIYADEACFASRLNPRQDVSRLKEAQLRDLFKAIPAVLKQALGNGGTSLMDYRRADGTHGLNQGSLAAYGRAGQACLRCGTTLKKTQVSQRTTVYCPHCQRLR